MQFAMPSLRCHRAQTGSSYLLAGKCVNSFVYRVLINTTRADVVGAFCSAGFSLWVFFSSLPKSQTPQSLGGGTALLKHWEESGLVGGRIQPPAQFLLALQKAP